MDETQLKGIIEHGENQEIKFKQVFHRDQEGTKKPSGLSTNLVGLLIISIYFMGEIF